MDVLQATKIKCGHTLYRPQTDVTVYIIMNVVLVPYPVLGEKKILFGTFVSLNYF